MGVGVVQVLATSFALLEWVIIFSPQRAHFESFSNRGLLELILLVLFGALVEELVFRRIGFNLCFKWGFRMPTTIILTSMVFGLSHWLGTSWFSAVYTATFGLLLGWVYSKQRPVLTAVIALHLIANLTTLSMAALNEEDAVFALADLLEPIFLLSVILLCCGVFLFSRASTRGSRAPEVALIEDS